MDKSLLKKAAMSARKSFTGQISQKLQEGRDHQKITEKTAYTWFIRCIALRYMQMNDFLPFPIRWTKEAVLESCVRMNRLYPELFTEVSDQQRQLMPQLQENVLSLFARIPRENWYHQPQIVGWLVQYYNTESKEKVFRRLKNKTKISAEDIPAVTQLFTPRWIADFMVQNTAGSVNGRYRILAGHEHGNPEKLHCIDPCMGCGHILLTLFDELFQQYRSQKISSAQAVRKILTENIAGLDIDPTAYHVSRFCLLMRAREWDETILEEKLDMPLAVFTEMDEEDLLRQTPEKLKNAMISFMKQMNRAVERGSLIQVHDLDLAALNSFWKNRNKAVEHNLRCAQLLSSTYDVVITNPPYMGHAGMSRDLSEFVKENYPEGKLDLFACFILRCMQLCRENGLCAMITQHSWMFLSSYRKLREKLLKYDLKALLHLGSRSFEEITGEVVQTVCFIMQKSVTPGNKALCFRLLEGEGEQEKRDQFLQKKGAFVVDQSQLLSLPGSPLAYWAGESMIRAFTLARPLSDYAESRQGMATADNERFVRRWFEVDRDTICFHACSKEQALNSHARWFPYNKGGNSRKWYGNNEFVVDWENDGQRIREYPSSVIRNEHHFFEECFSWSLITTGTCTFRYKPAGQCFDVAGMSCFTHQHLLTLLGFCNTLAAQHFLQVLAPTINVQCGDLARLPIYLDEKTDPEVERLVTENIELAKQDWDQFETSWDFTVHPMLQGKDVQQGLQLWKKQCRSRFEQVKANEQRLEHLFASRYGVEETAIKDEDITMTRFSDEKYDGQLDENRAIRTLLHYAVGCILKRYPLQGYQSRIEDNWLILTPADLPDVVDLLEHWLSCAYPDSDAKQQINQIASILDPQAESRQALYHYFCHDYYPEHVRMFQKRPVYWMIDAGKRNGFKALCAIHHWKPDGISQLFENHLMPEYRILKQQLNELNSRIKTEKQPETRQQLKNRKLRDSLRLKQVEDLAAKLDGMRDAEIELDLDKGVRNNLKHCRIFTQVDRK